MYNAKAHQEHDLASLHRHMLQTRLAMLVSHGVRGLLASHLPILLDPDEGPNGTAYAHLARANPQWQELGNGSETLLVFPGPDAYVSPGFYPSKAQDPRTVPTWNYLSVHAYGQAEVIQDGPRLLDIVSRLTDRHEHGRNDPWQVADAPADYIEGMLRAIVGVRLPIERLQGARKLSQNRAAADIEGVRTGLAASVDPLDNQLSAQMRPL